MDHLVKLDESVYLANHKFLMLSLKQIITVAEKAWGSIPSLAKRTIWFLYLVQVTPFDREGLASDICSKKGPPDQSLRPSIWPGQVSRASFDCVCVVLKRRSWLMTHIHGTDTDGETCAWSNGRILGTIKCMIVYDGILFLMPIKVFGWFSIQQMQNCAAE